jgi:hypothetical protein
VNIKKANSINASIEVPADAKGKTIHVMLTVRDEGSPPLVGYRRLVITGEAGN